MATSSQSEQVVSERDSFDPEKTPEGELELEAAEPVTDGKQEDLTQEPAAPRGSLSGPRLVFRPSNPAFISLKKQATTKFNLNPKKSMQFLVESGLISQTPEDFAYFMLHTEGLSKKKIGEFFGKADEFNQRCLREYLKHFDFAGEGLDDALRDLLRAFRLPGEAQQIDRILETFAARYYETNSSFFTSCDTVFILSFSLIMLNTDLHSRNINEKQRMTLEAFINTNRGIDQGRDLDRDMLTQLYERIKTNEIRMNEGDMFESEVVTFIGPKMSGWLAKKSENLMASWKRHWFVLTDSCLYYFTAPSHTDPRCIIPMENVRVGRGRNKKELLIQPALGLYVKSVKKLDDGRMEQGQHREFILRAETEEEREKWVQALQSELTRNPASKVKKIVNNTNAAAKPASEVVPERVEFPPPIEQGWLRKRGDFNPSWRRRYCVLFAHDHGNRESGPVLYYFGSKELALRMIDLGEITHKGFIFISDVTDVRVCQDRAQMHEVAFELVTTERTWTVLPENQEDFNKWLTVLSNLVAQYGNGAVRRQLHSSSIRSVPHTDEESDVSASVGIAATATEPAAKTET